MIRLSNILMEISPETVGGKVKDPTTGRFTPISPEEYIERVKERFPEMDFSKAVYVNRKTPFTVICPKHGEFQTNKLNLDRSRVNGCPTCSAEYLKNKNRERSIGQRKTQEEFLKRVKEVWGDTYDLTKTQYVDRKTKVVVTCRKHGDFEVPPLPFQGLSGGPAQGCPTCSEEMNVSKGEQSVRNILHKYGIEHDNQYAHKDCVGIFPKKLKTCYVLRFDFYLPKLKTFIEFDGQQHFTFNYRYNHLLSDDQISHRYLKQIYSDITKNEFAKRKGIKMIRISYNDFKNLEKEITQGLNSKEQLYLSTNYPKDMGWRDEELASVAREEVKDLFENINRINSLII